LGKKGKNTHLKSLAAPKTYNIRRSRRGRIFVARSIPGPHRLHFSLPLYVILRDFLSVTRTTRESKIVVNSGKVAVDGKVVREPRIPVGVMDTVIVAPGDDKYRMLVDKKGRLALVKIRDEEADLKPCRITKKFTDKKGIIKVTLHDGRQIALPPELALVEPGDSILLALPKPEIREVARLASGAVGYIFKGRSAGSYGAVQEIQQSAFKKPCMIRIKNEEGKEVTTVKDYLFIIGTKTPWISLSGVQ
jgi:small subunit ribosomal protein S4e